MPVVDLSLLTEYPALGAATIPVQPAGIPAEALTYPPGELLESLPTARKAVVTVPRVLLLVDIVAFLTVVPLASTLEWKSFVQLALTLGLFYKADLYRPRLALSVLDDAPTVVGRAAVAGAAAMALGSLRDGTAGTARLTTGVLFAVVCVLARALTYAALRALRRGGHLQHRTLVLGGGFVAGSLATTLLDHPVYGLLPVGLLDGDPLLQLADRPVPLLGDYRDLSRVLLAHEVDSVIVTFGSAREPQVVEILRTCDRLAADIFFVPRLFELYAANRDTEVIWGVPLVRLRRASWRTPDWKLKRVVDVLLSASALLLLLPLLAVCAVLARWETGTVLFRQSRVGLDGHPVTVIKFCSMAPATTQDSETRWNIAGDERLGRIGSFLRRTSFDEFPQLWNILRGDMSLVGPRPERPHFVEAFTQQVPRYMARHRVPVGLTGWAQVHGLRGNTSIPERARFDNYYIENWSLGFDLKILLRTAGQVFRAVGR